MRRKSEFTADGKHKHVFRPGYDFCSCGTRRCDHRDRPMPTFAPRCKRVTESPEEAFCSKHKAQYVQAVLDGGVR